MSKIEYVAIIIVIITVVSLIVLPRLCFKYTENPLDAINLINNIFAAEAVLIVLLMGLIIALRK